MSRSLAVVALLTWKAARHASVTVSSGSMATVIPLTDVRAATSAHERDAFVRDAARDEASTHAAVPLDTPPPAAARPAHLGHRPLQLPLRLLHAEGRVRRAYFLPRAELLTFEEIARVARDLRRPRRRKIRLTGGEPLLRRNLERLIEMLAIARRRRPTLTTNGSLLAREGARATRCRPSADHRQPRLARRRDVSRDERRRLPGRSVLEAIDAAAAPGFSPIKVNAVVKRGHERARRSSRSRGISADRPHRALHRITITP